MVCLPPASEVVVRVAEPVPSRGKLAVMGTPKSLNVTPPVGIVPGMMLLLTVVLNWSDCPATEGLGPLVRVTGVGVVVSAITLIVPVILWPCGVQEKVWVRDPNPAGPSNFLLKSVRA